MIRILTHSFISIFLLSTTLSKIKLYKKNSNILYVISSVYVFLYIIKYRMLFSTISSNYFYLIIYLVIIGFYLYLTYVFLDKKT